MKNQLPWIEQDLPHQSNVNHTARDALGLLENELAEDEYLLWHSSEINTQVSLNKVI